MTLDGERKNLLTTTYILESFKIRKELGLDDSYIMHPLREGMFIQRQLLGDWLYSESNGYVMDIYGVWLVLDDLVARLQVQQKLKNKGQ